MKFKSTAVVVAVMVLATASSAQVFAADTDAGKPNPVKAAVAKAVGKVCAPMPTC